MLIRLARLQDAGDLPLVEKSAAKLFLAMEGLSWLANGPVISQAEHERLIRNHTVWVAEAGPDGLIGFINAEVFEDELHVWELSVHEAWQRLGVGRKLMLSASEYALMNGLDALTLTTFSDVPWCAPAYSKLGFRPLPQPGLRLQAALDAEDEHGLPIARRLAMRLQIGTPSD